MENKDKFIFLYIFINLYIKNILFLRSTDRDLEAGALL